MMTVCFEVFEECVENENMHCKKCQGILLRESWVIKKPVIIAVNLRK